MSLSDDELSYQIARFLLILQKRAGKPGKTLSDQEISVGRQIKELLKGIHAPSHDLQR